MKNKIIIRREAMEQPGLAEKILPLSKIVSAEQHAWILVPENNFLELTHLLKTQGVHYEIEGDEEALGGR